MSTTAGLELRNDSAKTMPGLSLCRLRPLRLSHQRPRDAQRHSRRYTPTLSYAGNTGLTNVVPSPKRSNRLARTRLATRWRRGGNFTATLTILRRSPHRGAVSVSAITLTVNNVRDLAATQHDRHPVFVLTGAVLQFEVHPPSAFPGSPKTAPCHSENWSAVVAHEPGFLNARLAAIPEPRALVVWEREGRVTFLREHSRARVPGARPGHQQ